MSPIPTCTVKARTPLFALSLLLLVGNSNLHGQGSQTNPPFEASSPQNSDSRSFVWPNQVPGFACGAFGKSQIGDLDGDFTMDAIVRRGDRAFCVFSPYSMEAIGLVDTLNGGGVTAISLVRNAATGRDDVIVSNALGLVRYQWDQAGFDAGTLIESHAHVQSARKLITTNFGYGSDLLVLSADGLSASIVTGPGGTYALAKTFSLGTNAGTDIVALNHSGHTANEIAVLQADKVWIYNNRGVSQASVNNLSAGGGIAVVRSTDGAYDQLAMAAPLATYHDNGMPLQS